MKFEEMKAYIKNQGKASMVKELVEDLGTDIKDAVPYVYDVLTLSNSEFAEKYFEKISD